MVQPYNYYENEDSSFKDSSDEEERNPMVAERLVMQANVIIQA